MENFDDFFNDQYQQDNNQPNYHTPDKEPKKNNHQQVVIICLSVLVVVLVIAMIVNAIVLSTMRGSIENDYILQMKEDMKNEYDNALKDVIDNNNLKDDIIQAAKDTMKTTVGELAKEKYWNSAVQIYSERQVDKYNKTASIGSGFLIQKADLEKVPNDKKGKNDLYIITNAHVALDSANNTYVLNDKITATFTNGDEFEIELMYCGSYAIVNNHGQILKAAEPNRPDLAILRFKGNTPDLTKHPAIEINVDATIEEGQPTAIIGSPQGIGLSISTGIISKTNLVWGVDDISPGNFFMTDAAINGGNSGGPVFNKTGQLVGVVESKIVKEGVESMGFAISIETLDFFLSNLDLQYVANYK